MISVESTLSATGKPIARATTTASSTLAAARVCTIGIPYAASTSFASSSVTTWMLCTICLRTYTGAP